MLRCLPLLLLLAIGCRRADPEAAKDSLPTLSPKSGGAMVLIPAGSFTMGEKSDRPDETPHTVSVGAFYLDTTPVTQELFERVMGVNPSKQKAAKNPVERTQWTDAVRFCNKCSELDGLTPCYDLETWTCNFAADGYRLPTEAEFEYAARAGSPAKYSFGDDPTELPRHAWLKPGSQGHPQPVGTKPANRWGLFDMTGNVWEWCNDWYAESYDSAASDPHGPAAGKMRVLRGGAWDSTTDQCRAAYRHKEFPVYSDACFGADSYGFRRARSQSARPSPVAVVVPKTSAPEPAPKIEPKVETKVVEAKPGKLDVSKLPGTIVFVSDRSGSLHIWSMAATGKDAKMLTKGDGPDADPRWSPDGSQILYTTLRGGFPELWLMNKDGSEPKFVTKGSQGSWGPDGKSIAFINDNQTFVRDLAAKKETLVTPKNWERCGVPAISPDGKRLAVASRHLGNIGIFLVDLDKKTTEPLKTEQACCTPIWSKDGKRMLCQTVNGHIHEVGLDGKGWDQLTFGADVQHDARYSPDGSMILFCRAPTPEGPWQICVKSIDGDEDEFVTLTKDGSNSLPDWHD
jgi:formylglycine-generating enzyme required for sulfatase activity